MAVSVTGTNITGRTDWEGIVAYRKVTTTTMVSVPGANYGTNYYINLELTMPPVKRTGNKYLINAWSSCDNASSGGGSGTGLTLWKSNPQNVSGGAFLNAWGGHAEYIGAAHDFYTAPNTWFLDDGTNSNANYTYTAGHVWTFRVYGQCWSTTTNFNTTNVGNRIGPTGYLQVFEISGNTPL